MSEQWKPVVGYEGLYEVSSKGQIRGLKSGKVLKLHDDRNGYGHLLVTLCKKGKSRTCFVHRVVAKAFHGPQPPNKPYVCHKDGNAANNTPQNLYWGTSKQNCSDAKIHGRDNSGERNQGAKLTEEQVRKILKLALEGFTAEDIFRSGEYPVCRETIQSIVRGHTWKHLYKELAPSNSLILTKHPKIIQGGMFIDDRGILTYFNDMNFFGVQRVYWVHHMEPGGIRAWHYHNREGKFMSVPSGTFLIGVANPVTDKVEQFVLCDRQPKILWIPPGYANGFKNLERNSILTIFSTSTLEESKDDDIRYVWNKWDIWNEHFR